ncbi:MAG: Secretion system C-terminal sorting domain, partial [Bacteroidota bacterium]
NMEVIELENDFYIYPNPTTDLVFFHIEDASDKGIISVYNIMGQLLTTKEFEGSYNAFIDIEAYKSGIYYYTLETKYSHKGKIIKR